MSQRGTRYRGWTSSSGQAGRGSGVLELIYLSAGIGESECRGLCNSGPGRLVPKRAKKSEGEDVILFLYRNRWREIDAEEG